MTKPTSPQLNIIIFSRDRPMQLQALLDSLEKSMGLWDFSKENTCKVGVLYKATSEDFQKGYSIIKNDKTQVTLLDQDDISASFKEQVKGMLNPKYEFTMFLVDDIVFKNQCNINLLMRELQSNKRALCVSLRLAKHITHCYPTNQDVKVPQEILNSKKELISFKWKDGEGDWGYPMSTDGHIFKTDFITKVLDMIQFNNPNQMESQMAEMANRGYFSAFSEMICLRDNSVLFNIPMNRVQEEFKNRHGNLYTPESLNELFLKGQRLIFSEYWEIENNAPHTEVEMEFWA